MLIVPSQHRKPTGVPGQAASQPAVSHASEAKFVTWFCAYKEVTRLCKLNSTAIHNGTAEKVFLLEQDRGRAAFPSAAKGKRL